MTAPTPRRVSAVQSRLERDEADYDGLMKQINETVERMNEMEPRSALHRALVSDLYILATRLDLAKAAVEKGLRRT